uniref:Uncharacterized protein n=1 Tax=viral metagenome TaxID=1070528 RepID=A0A6M3LJS4_9ZZZZ
MSDTFGKSPLNWTKRLVWCPKCKKSVYETIAGRCVTCGSELIKGWRRDGETNG